MSVNFEELVSDLSSFKVSNDENCAISRIDLYKSKSSSLDQESRRSTLLERQKSDRQKSLSLLRNIEEHDLETEKKANPFRNQLMLSEWLEKKPEDFQENWLCKLAPVGHRSLIVAHKGRTESYTKSGYRTATFPSLLPGGHNGTKSSYTVLDSVWCEERGCFYVLDVICYKGHPINNSETEFRFYWGGTKFSEDLTGIGEKQGRNRYPMLWVPHTTCDTTSLRNMLAEKQHFQIDGLLFYHKQCHYVAGATPLVGWLKPDMLNQVLDLQIDFTALQVDPRCE